MNERSIRSLDPQIEAALQEYLDQRDRGESVDREAFLSRYTGIADVLRNLIDAEEHLRKMPADRASVEDATISTRVAANQADETLPPRSQADPSACTTAGDLAGQFGRYHIVRVLGKGAMGAVYLAQDTKLKRRVAIKTPHFDDPSGNGLQRFSREAEAAAMLRHANICPIYDVGEIDGTHFISMAYIEGRRLSDVIQDGPPQTERQILIVVRKLATALQEAHDLEIVHRDLKPDNIMVDTKGEPIIMDFGLARTVCRDGGQRLTLPGAILGSPAYMSPEQVDGEPANVGPLSDQYSLGVVLYEMLTGQLPFRGSIINVVLQIITKNPPKPSDLRPGLDPRIEAICLKMMAKKSEDRFPSMHSVAREVDTILNAKPAESVPAENRLTLPAPPAPAAKSQPDAGTARFRRRGWWIIVACAGAIAATLAGLILIPFGKTAIVVDVQSPGVEVALKGTTLSVTGPDKQTVRVEPGDHDLKITYAGLVTHTNSFYLKNGETKTVSISVVDRQIVTRLEKELLGVTPVPAPESRNPSGSSKIPVALDSTAEKKPPQVEGANPARPETRLSESRLMSASTTGGERTLAKASPPAGGSAAPVPTDPDRHAAETILALGGTIRVRVEGREIPIGPGHELPHEPIQLTRVNLAKRPDLTDAALEPLRGVSHVLSVNLEDDHHIGDRGLASLANLESLQDLNLHGTEVTDAGLASVAHLSHLESLILGRTKITDAGLAHLEGLKNLRTIFLGNGPRVTDAGLAHLEHLTALECITLWGAPLNGPGLKYLSGLKRLRVLGLGRTHVNDEGIESLRNLHNLKRLHLGGTRVTPAGVKKLRKSLPGCRIATSPATENENEP